MPDLMKYGFLIAGLALFLVAGIGSFWRPSASLATIPAILLVFSANLDRIESFKASISSSVIEAKTRELTQTVDDAKEAIRQIRELALATAESLIDLRMNSDALTVSSPGKDEYRDQDAFKAKILTALQKMKIPEDRVQQIAASDRDAVLGFYANAAYRFGRDSLPQTKWSDFDKAYYTVLSAQAPKSLSPAQCGKLWEEFGIDSSLFSDYMADFQHYVDTSEQRRPGVWARRGTWGFGQPATKP